MPSPAKTEEVVPPEGFQIRRDVPVGRYPLLTVFPHFDSLEAYRTLIRGRPSAPNLAEETCVEVVRQDVWMYVAPHEVPPHRRGRWSPVVAPGLDCIVIGQRHLSKSPAMVLYMDILHELCHVVQRKEGQELWDPRYGYVDRPTELEAYRFVLEEARRRGASEAFLRDYLKVDWISKDEYGKLLRNLGVSGP